MDLKCDRKNRKQGEKKQAVGLHFCSRRLRDTDLMPVVRKDCQSVKFGMYPKESSLDPPHILGLVLSRRLRREGQLSFHRPAPLSEAGTEPAVAQSCHPYA